MAPHLLYVIKRVFSQNPQDSIIKTYYFSKKNVMLQQIHDLNNDPLYSSLSCNFIGSFFYTPANENVTTLGIIGRCLIIPSGKFNRKS
jgi:hypothetical protein